MKYTRNMIIWTADDEYPDCGICDNQDCDGCCENCGAEFGWKYYERKYERKEDNPELNKLASFRSRMLNDYSID